MVVIDSPPVVSVSDSLVLSGHASAVVYVVKADDTPYQLARAGIRHLHEVGAPLLGVILNCADLKQVGGYGAYGYGYGVYGEAKA
jgi:Mrp family chromosome partitioning ATPase